jgi:K+-sensing histidine kinase KdpD
MAREKNIKDKPLKSSKNQITHTKVKKIIKKTPKLKDSDSKSAIVHKIQNEIQNEVQNNDNLILTILDNLIELSSQDCDEKNCSLQLQSIFSEKFNLVESQFFFYENKSISTDNLGNISEPFQTTIKSLEENGIIEWTFEKNEINFIPNLNIKTLDLFNRLMLVPIKINNENKAIFCAAIPNQNTEAKLKELSNLKSLLLLAALVLINKLASSSVSKSNVSNSIILQKVIDTAPIAIANKISTYFQKYMVALTKNINAQLKLALTDKEQLQRRIELSSEKLDLINQISSNISNNYRIERNQKNLIHKFILSSVIQEIISDFKPICEQFEIKVTFANDLIDEENSCMILGNKKIIKLIIAELLLNSIEAIYNGGSINILLYDNRRNQINLSIVDDGVGISPDLIELIFEPFFTNKSSDEHTGIGLYFVKHQLAKYNSKISIFSEERKGTTVKLFFNKFAK